MLNNAKLQEQFNNEMDFIEDKINEFCEDMSTYCDSIIVICTKHNKTTNLTHSYRMNKGNVYASVGVIREWLKQQENQNKEDTEDEY